MRTVTFLLLPILILLVLTGCLPPSQLASAPAAGDGQPELAQLRQEQAELARQMQRLQDNLLLLEGRLHDQQQMLLELRLLSSQMVTPDGQKAGSGAAGTPLGAPRAAAPTEIYLQAFASYASGRCPEAITGFQEFLRLYPGNDYAGHALYWLGECYDSQQQHAAAADAFRQAAERSPQGGKAPEALARLAVSLQKLNHRTEAEEVLRLLRQRYPESAAAKRSPPSN
ncbi:MAG: tol-pal system protein YbgF [Desulfuromonadales bacterium]|nr:tol-pal system protein YbgF [Desulfuromonadales bacterium]